MTVRRNLLSMYTPAPPDHHAVLQGVDHFRRLYPEEMPAYADVHTWSRDYSEEADSDPRFLEADSAALASAVILALGRGLKKAPAKDWRQRKPRNGDAPAEEPAADTPAQTTDEPTQTTNEAEHA